MRILVTGGCGFIGSTLIKKLLLNKNNIVMNIDSLNKVSMPESLNNVIKNNNYSFRKIDIRNKKKLLKIILDFCPNKIFHLAAESHVDRSIKNPESFLTSNIVGTYNLLENCRLFLLNKYKNNKNFKIIHISTDEVYGSLNLKGKPFKESSKFLPNSPYAASKASSDLLCRAWFKTFNLPIIVTNCSNNYGPWQYPEKLIPVVIKKILKNKKIPIYGNGKNIRDWIHVEDHINALIMISNKGKIGETYNIGGDNEINNLNLVKNICVIADKIQSYKISSKNLISFVDDRLGHDFRYSIESRKLKNKLNYKCKIDFNKGLYQTVNWYINNEKWLLKK